MASQGTTRKRMLLALALLLLCTGSLWAYRRYQSDAQFARVQELEKEMRGPDSRNLSPDERREKWKQLKLGLNQLTKEQKRELFKEQRKGMQEKMDKYFSLSKKEKVAFLDAEIRKMESMRKQWAATRGKDGKGGPGGGRGAGGPGGLGGPGGGRGRGAGGPGAAGAGGPKAAGNSGTAASGSPPDPNQGGPSPVDRERRKKDFLDMTTPVERAQTYQYMQDMNARRKELGLPTFGPGRR